MPGVTGAAGRPPVGGRNTRADIVDAARRLFAEVGFDRTTMRSVAGAAGVDVALIYHHFASKDDLLVAALAMPEGAKSALRPIAADTGDPGAAVASTVLQLWENDPAVREQALAMTRTALSHEHAAQLVRDLHTTAILALVAEIVDEHEREFRAALIGAHLMGILSSRYLVKTEAMVQADPDDLIAAAAPVINQYLTGELPRRAAAEAEPFPFPPEGGVGAGRSCR